MKEETFLVQLFVGKCFTRSDLLKVHYKKCKEKNQNNEYERVQSELRNLLKLIPFRVILPHLQRSLTVTSVMCTTKQGSH